MKIFMLVPLLFLTFLTITYAASNKEEYELQERCGKRAEEFFKREFGNGFSNTDDGQSVTVYSNHYNKKLNKCFMLETATLYSYKDKSKGTSSSTSVILFDVNEKKEYGNIIELKSGYPPDYCVVLGKHCNSENEWDSLIKTYMEE